MKWIDWVVFTSYGYLHFCIDGNISFCFLTVYNCMYEAIDSSMEYVLIVCWDTLDPIVHTAVLIPLMYIVVLKSVCVRKTNVTFHLDVVMKVQKLHRTKYSKERNHPKYPAERNQQDFQRS
ncbi:uncharacterized protein LOC125678174 isoform X2 [Ostrea edulis]|uniref:uncharacterized protein LOC125678174 isoform X2 n=1 Tax=Ostrea edulis TaxID=37623 RepID=UPI0024AFAB36|nr:uncharacterized protein LOC125678174 isoform X2 [Ostrea edulis]